MLTVDKRNEVILEIKTLIDCAYKTNDYGAPSTVLLHIKKSSFDFVMNQIIEILEEV